MDFKIFKNFICPVFLLFNFSQPLKAKEFYIQKNKQENQTNKIIWSKVIPNNNLKTVKFFFEDHNNHKKTSNRNYKKIKDTKITQLNPDDTKSTSLKYYSQDQKDILNISAKNDKKIKVYKEIQLASYRNKKDDLEIQSDIQFEKNNIISAEGNVLVSYGGKFLKADTLVYDKSTKILNAKGNIQLIIGQQIFKMTHIQYNFLNKKGQMKQVSGLINTKNFVRDIISSFSESDIKKIESLLDFEKNKVLYTPGKVDNWIFFADIINIDGDNWKSDKAIFSNDLLQFKQVKIEINALEATVEADKLKFKSSLNYLILDEKLGIPFWFGKRTLSKANEGFGSRNSWNVGYDNLDKDGFFIGRKLDSINLSNNFFLSLEPQFLIQRASKGFTKSFVNKRDSVTGIRVKRDTTFSDYFALNSEIKGKVNNWDLKIEKQINSFDFAKFNDALRLKSNLSKEITFLNSKWESSFYSVYRDRVWNGSLGEAEIYQGYGSKLEKQNTWEINGIQKTELLSFGISHLRGEALHSNNLVTSLKGNVFYSFDQKIPIRVTIPSDKYVDSSYKYISEPLKKGISLNNRIELSSSLYENDKHQEYVGLGAGPEFIFGDFKNKFLDYTRISFFPMYKLKSGDSLFKFDQISDKFTFDISLDQQIYGPLILKSNAIFNLDSDSDEYGDILNSKISLSWKKRSYDFGIFYQPHNQAGGIAFSLFGFK